MDWSKIGARLDEVERAVALASQMGDDEVGQALRAMLAAALAGAPPAAVTVMPTVEQVATVAPPVQQTEPAPRPQSDRDKVAVARARSSRRRATQQECTQRWADRLHEWGNVPESWRRVLALMLGAETMQRAEILDAAVARGLMSRSACAGVISHMARVGWMERPYPGVYRLSAAARQKMQPQQQQPAPPAEVEKPVAPVALSGVPRLAVVSSDGVDPATRTARVLAHLEGCKVPQKTSQVAEALGFAEAPTGNALYRLQRAGQVAKVDGLWCLPAAADADTLEADCEAVLWAVDKARTPQPFEVLVERSGLGNKRTSAAVNDLVRRGVLVASSGSYGRPARGEVDPAPRVPIYDGAGTRMGVEPLAVVEVLASGYRIVLPKWMAAEVPQVLPSRDAVQVEALAARTRRKASKVEAGG